jgi:hypothetical protein
MKLFEQDLVIVNMGLPSFGKNLEREGARVVEMDWHPPASGNHELVDLLDRIMMDTDELQNRIHHANSQAVDLLIKAKPMITGIGTAGNVIPEMHEKLVLHSGPPVEWNAMCGPMRGAVIGALILEGLANNAEEAADCASRGDVQFAPCHHHQTVGPMAGVVTASMPVWILENSTFGNKAYCTLNEGLGKVLRYGAYSDEVITRLIWMKEVLAPILSEALNLHGPLDVRSIIAQALQMGDEVHNRNRAATSLLIRTLAPLLVRSSADSSNVAEVLAFMDGNDHFFLNISMPACKCALDPCSGIPGSSMISTMSRNGTEFGIRISGLGDQWFTAPAPMVDGLYLPGFTAQDAAPDIGDSVITESAGLGGFAMAAAPAIVQFVGGSASQALTFTRQMYDITLAEHPVYKIPSLDFRGTPTGIDLLKIIETGMVPVVNTGIAHRDPGIGMVGAGLVKPPMSCFVKALKDFVKTVQTE